MAHYWAKVWSLETYELLFSVVAHTGSILCLSLSADKKLLLSSAGDAIVNARNPYLRCIADTDASQVWCPETLKRLYSLYSKYDVGDVFCVVYSVELQTVYLGAQNTSIQVGFWEFPRLCAYVKLLLVVRSFAKGF